MSWRALSAVLIGENALVMECTDVLLRRGHEVRAVVSPNPDIRAWATGMGIAVSGFGKELPDFLATLDFDYLFSAGNLRMLPAEVLKLPRELPVNYHDALLPADAGLNASAWAVLNRATQHGVTWHVMTEEADAGDLLKQAGFPVEAGETSHSLNLKCLQAGVATFAELVDELAEGRATRQVQDRAVRTYHARTDRPAAAGVLSWRGTAEEIDAAVRASRFGPNPNVFCTASLAMPGGEEFVVVGDSAIGGSWSIAPPGTVVSISAGELTVATNDHDIHLRNLRTLDGRSLTGHDLAARWGIRPGHRLPDLTDAEAGALQAAYRGTIAHEAHWVSRLTNLSAQDLPFRTNVQSTGWLELAVPVTGQPDGSVAAATLAYLAGVSRATGDIGVRQGTGNGPMLASLLPMRVPEPRGDFAGYRRTVVDALAELAGRGSYVRDVVVRYPVLAGRQEQGLPILVEFAETPAVPQETGGAVLVVQIHDGGRRCRWLLADGALGQADAQELRDGFLAFWTGLTATPSANLQTLPLLDESRRELLLGQWNDTATPYPSHACVPELFAERARLAPDAPALSCGQTSLTYGELGRRANALARRLAGHGAGPGGLVGVYLKRSADLVVALLAVMKSGAAYVPLDPLYPKARITAMLEDAGAELVITQRELADDLPGDLTPVLVGDFQDAAPFDRAAPDLPAYVIYTSGSTGRPKGVQIGHRALTNFLHAMAATPGFTERDTVLALTTVCFDIAGLELFLPLITGGQVHLASAETAADGFALSRLIEQVRPSVLQATPATWNMLVAAGWRGDPSLRVLCGGEALAPDLAEALLARAGEMWNMYGPTETTVWSAATRVRSGEPIVIGRPIANTTFYVLDAGQRLLPRGAPGELFIGGDGVADGYLGRPELTAERFVPDPFGPPGSRLYRTGDLVRWNAAGQLEFLGRTDHQVKIRGFRIELGEIEATLIGHPDVDRAVVVARPDQSGLTGYVVPAAGRGFDAVELRRHVAESLPDYMVPAAIIAMQALPLTPNGKIDRKALPEPRVETGRPYRQPATAAEKLLCELFAGLLGLDTVGADDGFFELGGTSITAVRLVAAARDAGLPMEVREVFQNPTPALLAARKGATTGPDLPSEVALAADIVPAAQVVTEVAEPRHVLLTGATGFLGAFLLRELLDSTSATVHCLVRAQTQAAAMERLRATLSEYSIELDHARIRAIPADLARPLLGMDPAHHDELAVLIDAVYHAGATVHWLHPYTALKAANVTGTEQVLRLAAQQRTVPVHYVSSMGVFAHAPAGAPRHRPDAQTGPPQDLLTGYQQSKWVTEQNLRLAIDRGLPISLYRVARISGDSRTGACQQEDFLWLLLKGCIQAGGAPDLDPVFDLVPVDHVASAIVTLSLQPAGATFHLSNPTLTAFSTLVDHLRDAGYDLPDLDRRKWLDLVAADPANAAHSLADTIAAWSPARTEIPLQPSDTGIACPPVDPAMLEIYLDRFITTGYFPPPPTT